jgi:hypothetical protein
MKPRSKKDGAGLKIVEMMAISSDATDVLIYADTGGRDPIPVRVPRERLDSLVLAAMDALRGEVSTR